MILVLTQEYDPHTDMVLALLEKRSINAVRFDTDTYPRACSIGVGVNTAHQGAFLVLGGKRVDLAKVDTVWNRRPRPPSLPEGLAAGHREFAIAECVQLEKAIWDLLADRFWINSYDNAVKAEHKAYQLRTAQRLGFDVPRTIITNDPQAALEFAAEGDREIVYKPLTSHYERNTDGSYSGIYTTVLKPSDIATRANQIATAPCIFQDYVAKQVEIRATVIGGEVLSAEIHSQQSERSKHDWRRYDLSNTPYRPHELPKDVKAMLISLLAELGLVFACVDLILTADDRYVFLELNQSGQWYWVEMLTQLPILETFVRLLTRQPQRNTELSPLLEPSAK